MLCARQGHAKGQEGWGELMNRPVKGQHPLTDNYQREPGEDPGEVSEAVDLIALWRRIQSPERRRILIDLARELAGD